jgi:hypothetical protein
MNEELKKKFEQSNLAPLQDWIKPFPMPVKANGSELIGIILGDAEQRLSEIAATLWVNFGSERTPKILDETDKSQNTFGLFIKCLEYFVNERNDHISRIKELEQKLKIMELEKQLSITFDKSEYNRLKEEIEELKNKTICEE